MNVIVTNQKRSELSTLDIDIIKSISGVYEANEIVEMFKNFFYSKMILDVTAIKNYNDIRSYQTIATGLEAEKIIFYLPEGSELCTSNFLANLVRMGIYNFTTNIEGVKYLLRKSNTHKDVAHIEQLGGGGDVAVGNTPMATLTKRVINGSTIIGIRNVTPEAGATTLIYMLKKELNATIGNNVVAIEIDKNDFQFFNDKTMISTSSSELRSTLDKYRSADIILIDLNDSQDDNMCADVFYLLEPSTLKLNRLIKRNRNILTKLKDKKVILNKSLLTNKDVSDFEYESNLKIFFNMPPLNDRKRNAVLTDFLSRVGLLEKEDSTKKDNNSRIFGLFRR